MTWASFAFDLFLWVAVVVLGTVVILDLLNERGDDE